jgi:hypothetical protein
LRKGQALYVKAIVIIPVLAILFAIIASAVGIGVVITNQVIELLVSGGIVQSAETAANSDNDDEKEPYTGDARIDPGQQGEAGGIGNQQNNPGGADNDANGIGTSEPGHNNDSSGLHQGNNKSNPELSSLGSNTDYESLVKPSIVTANVKTDTNIRRGYSNRAKVVCSVSAGEEVAVIKSHNSEWFYVETKTGEAGWVYSGALDIPDDPETNPNRLTTEQLEGFVEYKELNSPTGYLVWVDIDRQLVNVFTKENGKWKLDRSIPCSTGRNRSPTLRGIYKIQDRGLWFYNEKLQSGAKYWVRYSGPYLFHSVAMDRNQEVEDPTLGKRASYGCIRLSIEDSKWFYDNISEDTTVFVY